jgi:hypothetical protein
MESFFASLLPFLVVAFVGVRIVFLLRRRKNNRQGQEAGPAAAPQGSARGFAPWEDEFRDGAAIAGEGGPAQTASDDDGFSAWDLSVDDAPPVPVVDPPVLPRPPEAPRPAFAVAPPESVARPPDPEDAARRPGPGQRLEQRFRGLPPLQQAVVWGEILGAPKGL